MPALIMLGLPANTAVATNRFGLFGSAISGIFEFAKAKKIVYKYIIPLTVMSLIGSFIGARILIEINEELLSKLIGILIIILLPFIFVKNHHGLKRKIIPKYYKIGGFMGYFGLTIYDGIFGAAGGIFVTYILIFLFGLTYIESNATDKIPWLANITISVIVFAVYGLINYLYGIILFLGMVAGGILGAKLAIKKGENFVRIAFAIIVLASAIKLIFF